MFDGRSYPDNPTMPPARKMANKANGLTVIRPNDPGKPLF
jgi:hypothetical protein